MTMGCAAQRTLPGMLMEEREAWGPGACEGGGPLKDGTTPEMPRLLMLPMWLMLPRLLRPPLFDSDGTHAALSADPLSPAHQHSSAHAPADRPRPLALPLRSRDPRSDVTGDEKHAPCADQFE